LKCPICNAWTSVLDTRNRKDVTVRRRKCANEHVFKTEERVTSPKTKEEDELHNCITATD